VNTAPDGDTARSKPAPRMWGRSRLNAITGMFVAVFEGEFGDAGFV